MAHFPELAFRAPVLLRAHPLNLPEPTGASGLKKGQRVRHSKYGDGDDAKVTFMFTRHGMKSSWKNSPISRKSSVCTHHPLCGYPCTRSRFACSSPSSTRNVPSASACSSSSPGYTVTGAIHSRYPRNRLTTRSE